MMNLVFRLLVSSILERLDILCFKIADLKSIVLLVFFSYCQYGNTHVSVLQ